MWYLGCGVVVGNGDHGLDDVAEVGAEELTDAVDGNLQRRQGADLQQLEIGICTTKGEFERVRPVAMRAAAAVRLTRESERAAYRP